MKIQRNLNFLKLNEDDKSKLICISICLLLINVNDNDWNFDWTAFNLFVVEKIEILNFKIY